MSGPLGRIKILNAKEIRDGLVRIVFKRFKINSDKVGFQNDVFNQVLFYYHFQLFRGTVYRDISLDDPDCPECLRMGPPNISDDETALQRSMSLVSMETTPDKPPTQVMSVSDDEELEPQSTDWAEQMQQESDERQNSGTIFILEG